MAASKEPIHIAPAQHPGITIQTKKSHTTLFDTTIPGVKFTSGSPTIEQKEAINRLKIARSVGTAKIDDPLGLDSSTDATYSAAPRL